MAHKIKYVAHMIRYFLVNEIELVTMFLILFMLAIVITAMVTFFICQI